MEENAALRKRLAKEIDQLSVAAFRNRVRTGKLRKELSDTNKKKEKIKRHLRHYRSQRAKLTSIEESLPNGGEEIVVYEDFVAQYDLSGNKWVTLVFAVKWRDEHGELRTRYLDTVAGKVNVINSFLRFIL